jgi:hypothetical protein
MWFEIPHPYIRPTPGPGSDRLAADELEAFVHGRLHRLAGVRGGVPATVLQLNRVAHGTMAELEKLAAPKGRARRAGGRWVLARLLARDVLAHAHHPDDVARVQRVALWPLEDALLSSSSSLASDAGIVAFVARSAMDDLDDGRAPAEP